VEKSGPKICTTSAIFKDLPKENNVPIGESSPNLVTLFKGDGENETASANLHIAKKVGALLDTYLTSPARNFYEFWFI
jgi:hypothetical protein